MKAVGYKNPLPISDENSLVDMEVPIPSASGRDLLVEIKAVSVNPVDIKVRATTRLQVGCGISRTCSAHSRLLDLSAFCFSPIILTSIGAVAEDVPSWIKRGFRWRRRSCLLTAIGGA